MEKTEEKINESKEIMTHKGKRYLGVRANTTAKMYDNISFSQSAVLEVEMINICSTVLKADKTSKLL